ncbi:hypothetical protein [Clostridium septicum]|uniref:hypothetical protein n=1 Tax=Clostridium septicum TaxID=1504 RepID=UPI000834B35F|nr:hypothetical protein [Clostridium septicum]
MAKTTKSFSLEEDIIKRISDYKIQNNLSSDSAALERIILLFNSNTSNNIDSSKLDIIENLLAQLLLTIENSTNNLNKNEIKEKVTEIMKINNDGVDDSVMDIFNNMQE